MTRLGAFQLECRGLNGRLSSLSNLAETQKVLLLSSYGSLMQSLIGPSLILKTSSSLLVPMAATLALKVTVSVSTQSCRIYFLLRGLDSNQHNWDSRDWDLLHFWLKLHFPSFKWFLNAVFVTCLHSWVSQVLMYNWAAFRVKVQ